MSTGTAGNHRSGATFVLLLLCSPQHDYRCNKETAGCCGSVPCGSVPCGSFRPLKLQNPIMERGGKKKYEEFKEDTKVSFDALSLSKIAFCLHQR